MPVILLQSLSRSQTSMRSSSLLRQMEARVPKSRSPITVMTAQITNLVLLSLRSKQKMVTLINW